MVLVVVVVNIDVTVKADASHNTCNYTLSMPEMGTHRPRRHTHKRAQRHANKRARAHKVKQTTCCPL